MFSRYEGAAWERHFLPRLTSKQVSELPKKEALIVLSIGAVEQHGAHLPVMTDSLIGEATLTKTMEKLGDDQQVWLIPPLNYGKSNEHIGIPGTIALSDSTLKNAIVEIAQSLKDSGFRRLLLFNTHGGNIDLLNVVAREIRIQTGIMVFVLSPSSLDVSDGIISKEEQEYGIHGGDYETSIVMAIKPNWVQEEFLTKEIPDLAAYKFLTMEGKIRFAWKMADISASGIAGDATIATPEKGQALQERVTDLLAQALKELCSFEIEDVLNKREQELERI